MKAGPGRPNENGLKCHESDKSYMQRKKQTWKVTEEEKDRTEKKGRGNWKQNPNCWQWRRIFILRDSKRKSETFSLSRLPCGHPYNHFAVY